jgi:16S rRNA (adenine1518-N6/adenine1519-N6)-dimethyltransferase
VLDIGAGMGFLTRFLANKCRTVIAVEFDARLINVLREQLAGVTNTEIIAGDVLKLRLPPFNKIVSVPPYHISSRLLLWLFCRKFDCATLVFQKEFADRLAAPIASDNYGWLTVVTYYYAEVELQEDVPKSMFYPPPKIDSIIVRLKLKKRRPFTLINEAFFKQLLKSVFASRNRKVRNAVLSYLKASHSLTEKDSIEVAEKMPFRDKRVRELSPEDFGVLANAIAE